MLDAQTIQAGIDDGIKFRYDLMRVEHPEGASLDLVSWSLRQSNRDG